MDEQVRPMRVQSFAANNLQVSENGRSGGSGKKTGGRSVGGLTLALVGQTSLCNRSVGVGSGRSETCKLFLLRSLLASDAPAHPCFLCVMSGNFKNAKKRGNDFAPKIVHPPAPK